VNAAFMSFCRKLLARVDHGEQNLALTVVNHALSVDSCDQ
jgi:hypothetical protein